MPAFVRRLTAVALAGVLAIAFSSVALAAAPTPVPLDPPPSDIYTCQTNGGGTVCRATEVAPYELEPLGIWCGSGAGAFEILDSGTRHIRAKRVYDTDGHWVSRTRTLLFKDAYLTNPLTGATVDYVQHNTDMDVFGVPSDFSTVTFTGHGVLSVTAPGSGAVLLEAGRVVVGPNGDLEAQAGPSDVSDYFGGNAEVAEALCAALGA
jgi:hypothetical protein